jgi:hypothetical protein
MMHGEVVTRAAPLTLEAVSFQRFLAVAAEVKIVSGFSYIPIDLLFRHFRQGSAYGSRFLYRGARGTTDLRSAVVNEINPTISALSGRSNNGGVGATSISGQSFLVFLGANDGDAQCAEFLTSACRFVTRATFHANALSKSIAGFAVRFERAGAASLCVGRLFHHLFAAAWTGDGSVRSCCHEAYYNGGWRIV